MKYLIVSVIVLSCLTAQDILITDQGVTHKGKYISSSETHIEFQILGAAFPMNVEKSIIARVVLDGGQVVYDDGTYVASSTVVDSMPDSIDIDVLNTQNLELRQTEALENIATAQTYFMYYSVVVTILMVFSLVAASS